FNNDGLDDLLLVRFNNRGSDREQKFKEEIVLYQNLGAKKGFKEIKNFYPLKDRLKAMPAAIADFNGDGLLDFYVGYPGAKDFTFMDAHMPKNSGNDVQGLYYNQGNFKFKEVSSEAIKDKRLAKSQEQILFPHSSLAADIDMDNDMDLIIIDDRGNLSPIYANNGLGEFSPIHQKIHVSNDDYGMGFAIGDLDNDGILDVLYSNVNFYASQRLLNSGLLNHDYSYAELKGLNGLKVYKGSKSKSFIDITKSSIDFDPGEGVAGVEMIDFNNDGFLDIYVTNGLWSGSDRGQDLSSLFMRADRNTPFNTSLGDNRESFKESQSEFMAILRQFKGDINNKKSKSSLRPSMAGHQRNRLYRNNGDSTFTEVGFLEGVDSLADGYMVTKADLNNDGKLDIVLRNCDPGTEIATFAPVQVFINNHKNKNSLRLKLIGKRSNRNGIGAHVTAYIGKRKIIQHLLGSNGTVQSEKIIHIGLENKSKADRVVITWPSGNRSELKNLKSGFHKIIEPGAQKTIVLNK
ncbi:MAG: CRTAC1 family protein, partial [Halobacteriovoraceae bacterium]|nr:CRTAC1 family protein [Halobacteriovoraceae bacterium]